jgi:hypothetical protein
MRRLCVLLLALVATTALLSGCVSSGVTNSRNAFSYGGQMASKGGTESYAWQNDGSAAQITWGGQGTGTVTVTLRDSAGTQVYQGTFGNGQGGTAATSGRGLPGTWHVDLGFTGFSGQMGLSITSA